MGCTIWKPLLEWLLFHCQISIRPHEQAAVRNTRHNPKVKCLRQRLTWPIQLPNRKKSWTSPQVTGKQILCSILWKKCLNSYMSVDASPDHEVARPLALWLRNQLSLTCVVQKGVWYLVKPLGAFQSKIFAIINSLSEWSLMHLQGSAMLPNVREASACWHRQDRPLPSSL